MLRRLLTLALLAAPATAVAGGVVRRAVVVAAHEGGVELEPLEHTEEDARRVAEVLEELGGFRPEDVVLVTEASEQEVVEALHEVARAPVGEGEESLFLFYYSGHADARGLRLESEVLSYEELRSLVRAVPADVHLGILDACQSGAISRVKGAAVAEPFLDEQRLASEGEAWIAASSADEEAQESDLIEGSFFTHYLVSGLRGAADDGDGIVSLTEAYDYAHDRTVAHTAGTTAGPQHPSYDYRLQGNGDLPLTDVRRASATVRLPEELSGVVTVLREPDHLPVAEVAKIPGRPARLALQPGQYTLRLRDRGELKQVRVGLSQGSSIEVDRWGDARGEVTTAKGAVPVWLGDAEGDAPDPLRIRAERDDEGLTVRVSGDLLGTVQERLDHLHLPSPPVPPGRTSRGEEPAPVEEPEPPELSAGPSVASLDRVDLVEPARRPLRGLAVALNVPAPGVGQMIQGRWGAGFAFLGGAYLLTSSGTLAALIENDGGMAAGSLLGPNLVTMTGICLWGWSIADAVWVDRDRFSRPREGLSFSMESVWEPGRLGVPQGTGLAVDWFPLPGLSVGLDRLGYIQRPDGVGVLSGGLRVTAGPEFERLRPAVLLSLDGRRYAEVVTPRDQYEDTGFYPELEHEVERRGVLGLGTHLRWYATPRYFFQWEVRWEVEPSTGEQRLVAGGGFGVHKGKR